jgi:DNA-binding NtrC family response regulator
MNLDDRVRYIGQWLDDVSPGNDFAEPGPLGQRPYQERSRTLNTPRPDAALETIAESLVQAYLAANLHLRGTPLKEFMDGFEKRILLACLRLAQGNQKNVAAVLGIKPTALFEKLRKHGIGGRRRRPGGDGAVAREIA